MLHAKSQTYIFFEYNYRKAQVFFVLTMGTLKIRKNFWEDMLLLCRAI